MLRRVGLMSTVAVAFALVINGSSAYAQKPVNLAQVVSETFTIEAIDHSARIVTLKDKDGFVPGAKPGGTVSQQMTAVVTIEAIDAKVPSVTVKAADGRRMSFKVENAKNLEGYKAGDQVEVTYTQALAVSVTSATK
jgi:hypothetical protein